ncbi:MAG: hypothetical protein HYV27_05085 [Candidatus Hydrogenedentes bacterium]|nr:hypothetical protein [Candidatus Hydrogenedentota bacterium]
MRACKFGVIALVALLCGAPLFAAVEAPPNKWEKAIAEFEKEDAKAMPAPGGVLFVGSSTIRLWKVKEAFPDLPVLNRGFGGSEYVDLNLFFDRIVAKYQPKVIVLYAGDNDIAMGKTAETVAAEYKTLLGKIDTALPECRVITVGIKPSVARWNLYPAMKQVNEAMKQLAAEKPSRTFLDQEPLLFGADGKPDAGLLMKDGLHLNEAGYDKLTEAIRPLLTAALGG